MRSKPKGKYQRQTDAGIYSTTDADGIQGAFVIPFRGVLLRVLSSDGRDWEHSGMPDPPWEHVSVSLTNRCPTWEEMDYVKRMFWYDNESVIQYHVPRSDHISYHDFCLHLWRPIGVDIIRPPLETVGPEQR